MDVQFTTEYLAKADGWATDLSLKAAEAMGIADALKEGAKDLLAIMQTEIATKHKGDKKLSETELERLARASDRWQDYRIGQLAAMKEAVVLRQRAGNAQRHWETIRSGLTYRREELTRISGGT